MFQPSNTGPTSATMTGSMVDEGLRSYLAGVYRLMSAGLAVTGAVAYGVSQAFPHLMAGWTGILFMLLPLGLVFLLSAGLERMSRPAALTAFMVFAASMGISMSSIFSAYTGASIGRAFFLSAGTFAAFSIYGYTTKRDLTSMGSFLFMGLIGLLLASVVNIWLASGMLAFIVSVVTVLIFTGLTAYDTQKLKEEYLSQGEVYGYSDQYKSSIHGALQLYLDFINIFMGLLRLIGVTRD